MPVPCRTCGGELSSTRRTYCSDECRRDRPPLPTNRVCRQCGEACHGVYCSSRCGVAYRTTHGNRFCEIDGCPGRVFALGFCTEHYWEARRTGGGRSCVRCGRSLRASQKKEPMCGDCYKAFPPKYPLTDKRRQERRTARRRAEWESRRGERKRAEAVRRLARSAVGSIGGGAFYCGACHRCGTAFVSPRGQSASRFCSRRCQRAEGKDRRRARSVGAKITSGRRYAVYERDGWVCQICGDSVNRGAVCPELDAPVIDHRVPLARGGEHGPSNWQTAHFYCNSVKRDLYMDQVA